MPKLKLSSVCGIKICVDCGKKFYGFGRIKGYIKENQNLLEETFGVNEIIVCNDCYKKYSGGDQNEGS